MDKQQIDRELEQIEQQVVDASVIVARFGMAHCIAAADLDLDRANVLAEKFAAEYCESLVRAVRKMIATAGSDITAGILTAEAAAYGAKH